MSWPRFAAVTLIALISASSYAAGAIVIDQKGLVFNISTEALQRGGRLLFSNSDEVIHNIHIFTSDGEEVVDLGLQRPGVKLAYKFDAAGRFTVRCNIHPSMKMVVDVR